MCNRYRYIYDDNKKEVEIKEASDNRWLFYAALSAVFASLTSILGKVGISGIESNLGTALRTIVVLIMAWVVVFVSKKQGEIKNIDKKVGYLFAFQALQQVLPGFVIIGLCK